ncbi:unnamed protein product [Choristocarpus tenellus]
MVLQVFAGIPDPILFGTIGYAAACCFVLICLKVTQMFGGLSKDNTGVGFTVIITSTICMWLLWLVQLLHPRTTSHSVPQTPKFAPALASI